jgi:hypothetical protein
MATPDTDTNDSVHQALIDHIACEMGEGGPTVVGETESEITFRTRPHKERCIKQLSDRVDYEPVGSESVDQSAVDTNRELVYVTFQPVAEVGESQ